MSRLILLSLTAVTLIACDPASEEEFLRGRNYDPCLQTIPACPGLFASCTLDVTRYAKATFPGAFRFLVQAKEGQEVQVLIYFSLQRNPGSETLIFWNEPGCSDVYSYDSEGRDLFSASEESSLFEEKRTMLETGEHLVEIFSDMQAEVLISARVLIPGT